MIHLAIFASGSGTNAEKIMEYFEYNEQVSVSVIFSNKSDAFVIERAENFGVPTEVFDKQQFSDTQFSRRLDLYQVDYIVLAGFLWKIPEHLLQAFPDKIINIHPALLPKYGGKGMYGNRVHTAVLQSDDMKSGISIHLVNENYDEGRILFQAECGILTTDLVEDIAMRIHKLEHQHFPRVIEEYIQSCS